MKRLLSLVFVIAFACLGFTIAAKGVPQITFEQTKHDFGTIREADGSVTYTFKYTNTGTAPLTLTTVSAPCNCTTPQYSHKPVAPGKTGEIVVTFSPKEISGEFMRSISVWTNAKTDNGKKVVLVISGVVVPKK